MKSATRNTIRIAPLTLLLCALAGEAFAQDNVMEDRSAFRKAVADYQMFIVPHCAPDHARAYADARRDRDKAFVRSLDDLGVRADYDQAVADQAERDRQINYECASPPPPPGSVESDAGQIRRARERSLLEHFERGDQQFARVVALRDLLTRSASQ